jgi:YHS domain-containing protein
VLLSLIERLVLILIAVSVIRSVVRFLQGITGRFGTHIGHRANHSRQAAPEAQSPATMLQQDPVCGTYVAIDASLKRVVNGKVLHFCSDDCRNRYRG